MVAFSWRYVRHRDVLCHGTGPAMLRGRGVENSAFYFFFVRSASFVWVKMGGKNPKTPKSSLTHRPVSESIRRNSQPNPTVLHVIRGDTMVNQIETVILIFCSTRRSELDDVV